ncbi:MAG TPA: ABC transporter substrate-binding protein [candidate division Zixibacteria bacterium]|nr:ABC transporter substrate-binding protein [candidate division Zixibacteria bacterium]
MSASVRTTLRAAPALSRLPGAALAAFLLFCCSLSRPPDAPAELLRVALSTKDFGYLPLFAGIRSGLFARENLEIQWIQVSSNAVVAALMAGEIDVAGIAGSAMRAAARGAPLKANFFPYEKSLFVFMGAPGIKRVADLRGKIVGTTGPGATTEIAAAMVLQHHGLDPKRDVTFMVVGGARTSIAAMRSGVIHARAFNPDAAYVLKKQGFTELALLADMGPWPWAGYSTSDAHLANRRDKLKRWTRAMVQSLQLMLERPEEIYRIAEAEFGHPRDVTEAAANVCIRAIDARRPGLADDEALRHNVELTITRPLKLAAAPPLSQLVDFSLLREVHQELLSGGRR